MARQSLARCVNMIMMGLCLMSFRARSVPNFVVGYRASQSSGRRRVGSAAVPERSEMEDLLDEFDSADNDKVKSLLRHLLLSKQSEAPWFLQGYSDRADQSRDRADQSRDGPKAAGGGSSSNTSVLIAQGFLHPACKMFHFFQDRS